MTVSRRLVVWPHHPDMLQRPAANGAELPVTQALTWNVFRTLELMPPAFWLRRLNAALGLAPPAPAPVMATVRLWPRLPVAPGIGVSRRDAVDADVLIETEHAVWSLVVCDADDGASRASEPAVDRIAMLAGAASWYAGRRDCFVGTVLGAPERAPRSMALIHRYRASRTALELRVPPRGADLANVRGFGFASWRQLVAIVSDVSRSDTIDAVERAAAGRTVTWCEGLPCLA